MGLRKALKITVVTIGALFPMQGISQSTPADSWQCLTHLVTDLANTPTIINAVKHHNDDLPNAGYLEALWPYLSASDPIIQSRTTHSASIAMDTWIKEISIQGEGLLIGIDGGLVAATDKTTDYWQGDEAQFTEAIILTKDDLYVQRELVDESTSLLLVKISAPIYEEDLVLGVLVIGFDQFVIDFVTPCHTD